MAIKASVAAKLTAEERKIVKDSIAKIDKELKTGHWLIQRSDTMTHSDRIKVYILSQYKLAGWEFTEENEFGIIEFRPKTKVKSTT